MRNSFFEDVRRFAHILWSFLAVGYTTLQAGRM